MCDESHLEEALAQYKTQFLQIQTMLDQLGEEGQTDLVNVRNDLMELIQVTEESLLSLKKSNLLHLLEEQLAAEASQLPTSSDNSSTQDEASNVVESYKNDDIDYDKEELSVTGMKCRVVYIHEWGVSEQHNAMVLDVEDSDDNEDDPDTKVRVLFTHPTHASMLCCPYFMDGKCRFAEQDCRFSHGYVINLDDLQPFKEPDFRHLKVGHTCLARYEDGLWYKATIKSIDEPNVEIHYETYNMDTTLGMDSILPQNFCDDSPVDSDLEEDSEFGDDIDEDDIVAEFIGQPADKQYTSSGTVLGEWEVHTRGIASKLMAKMGYISGQGLGKDCDGRIEPVEVVLLPAGKSLDKCAQMRENNHLVEPFKKKKPKIHKGGSATSEDSSKQIKSTQMYLNL